MSAPHDADPDPRLERFARGELSRQEELELRAAAVADPELAADLELYEPYRDEALEPLADRFSSATTASRGRRPARRVAMAGIGVATALGIFAFALSSRSVEPLSDYELAVEGGAAAALRGQESHEVDQPWRLDTEVTLLLRPLRAVRGPVELSVFVREGEAWARRGVRAEVTDEGAVEATVAVGELFEGPGRYRLACVLSRPGAEPSPAEQGPHQVVLMRTVRVLDGP